MCELHWWNDTDSRKPKYLEKNLPYCHFIQHISHTDWSGIKRKPKGECDLTTWAMTQPYVLAHCLAITNTFPTDVTFHLILHKPQHVITLLNQAGNQIFCAPSNMVGFTRGLCMVHGLHLLQHNGSTFCCSHFTPFSDDSDRSCLWNVGLHSELTLPPITRQDFITFSCQWSFNCYVITYIMQWQEQESYTCKEYSSERMDKCSG